MVAKKISRTSRKQTSRSGRKNPKSVARKSAPKLWTKYAWAVVIVVIGSCFFYWLAIRPYAYRWKPCYGLKGYGVCMPCSYEVHGIDISHHQGTIDWQQLTTNRNLQFPLYFIFMKATEGGDFSDTQFAQNIDSARAHGFICGAYHYFIPHTDAVRQADFFIRTARLQAGDLPPVLDVETKGDCSSAELKAAVKRWLDRVERHYGVKPILYTSYKFKQRYLDDSLFNDYPYWIAHYYVDSVRYKGKWHFWQHTDVGTVPGIDKRVDLNVFNGTLDRLNSLRIPTDSIGRGSTEEV